MTIRIRLWIQAVEISFLHRVAGFSLRGRVKNSNMWRDVGHLPLEIFWTHPRGRRPRGRPIPRSKVYTSHLTWEHLIGSPERSWKVRGAFGIPCLTWSHHDTTVELMLQFLKKKNNSQQIIWQCEAWVSWKWKHCGVDWKNWFYFCAIGVYLTCSVVCWPYEGDTTGPVRQPTLAVSHNK